MSYWQWIIASGLVCGLVSSSVYAQSPQAVSEQINQACQKHVTVRMQAQFSPEQLGAYCDCSASGVVKTLSEDTIKNP